MEADLVILCWLLYLFIILLADCTSQRWTMFNLRLPQTSHWNNNCIHDIMSLIITENERRRTLRGRAARATFTSCHLLFLVGCRSSCMSYESVWSKRSFILCGNWLKTLFSPTHICWNKWNFFLLTTDVPPWASVASQHCYVPVLPVLWCWVYLHSFSGYLWKDNQTWRNVLFCVRAEVTTASWEQHV